MKKKKTITHQVDAVVMLDRLLLETACRDLSSLNISLQRMGEINLSCLTVSALRILNMLLSST